jgi:DNA transposition AAA+ family ATPase
MQDKLYRDLTAGQKTVGALANDYSVSKARIEAVRKLKEVEAEMKRQVSRLLLDLGISRLSQGPLAVFG